MRIYRMRNFFQPRYAKASYISPNKDMITNWSNLVPRLFLYSGEAHKQEIARMRNAAIYSALVPGAFSPSR